MEETEIGKAKVFKIRKSRFSSIDVFCLNKVNMVVFANLSFFEVMDNTVSEPLFRISIALYSRVNIYVANKAI